MNNDPRIARIRLNEEFPTLTKSFYPRKCAMQKSLAEKLLRCSREGVIVTIGISRTVGQITALKMSNAKFDKPLIIKELEYLYLFEHPCYVVTAKAINNYQKKFTPLVIVPPITAISFKYSDMKNGLFPCRVVATDNFGPGR